MSGLKPIGLQEFYRSLHGRGLTTDLLAQDLGVSGAKLRKLIVCLQPRRGLAWRGLLERLNERERTLLLSVEQCETWNMRQRAKRPVWTHEKVHGLAETYRSFEPAKEQAWQHAQT
jgi:hypothetical protein